MLPLFKVTPDLALPAPVLRTHPEDGSPRSEDGHTFISAAEAGKLCGKTEEQMNAMWERSMRDFVATTEDEASDEKKDVDWTKLSDEERRDRVRRIRCGGLREEFYQMFLTQAQAFGYDVDRGECYPRVVRNSDSGADEIVCVAKLEMLERRVLASGLFNGMEGPFFRAADGQWDQVWVDTETPPYACMVRIYRKGLEIPLEVVTLYHETVPEAQTRDGESKIPWFWEMRPVFMLKVRTLAEAFRKQYRDVIGNVYIAEELPTMQASPRRARPGRRASSAPLDGPNADGSFGAPAGQLGRRGNFNDHRDELGDVAYGDDALGSINNERIARAALAKIGMPHKSEQDNYIHRARVRYGTAEDDSPEMFWQLVVSEASRSRRAG